jgi:hypothetical protein
VVAGPSLRIRRLGSGNEKRPVIKSKCIFFKRAMFYLYFLKDKYKVPYICGTPIGTNSNMPKRLKQEDRK